ncbi:trp operon leader peptide [Escherichia coli O33:H4]|nr:trp operon leader peptide [Escherichia coli]
MKAIFVLKGCWRTS